MNSVMHASLSPLKTSPTTSATTNNNESSSSLDVNNLTQDSAALNYSQATNSIHHHQLELNSHNLNSLNNHNHSHHHLHHHVHHQPPHQQLLQNTTHQMASTTTSQLTNPSSSSPTSSMHQNQNQHLHQHHPNQMQHQQHSSHSLQQTHDHSKSLALSSNLLAPNAAQMSMWKNPHLSLNTFKHSVVMSDNFFNTSDPLNTLSSWQHATSSFGTNQASVAASLQANSDLNYSVAVAHHHHHHSRVGLPMQCQDILGASGASSLKNPGSSVVTADQANAFMLQSMSQQHSTTLASNNNNNNHHSTTTNNHSSLEKALIPQHHQHHNNNNAHHHHLDSFNSRLQIQQPLLNNNNGHHDQHQAGAYFPSISDSHQSSLYSTNSSSSASMTRSTNRDLNNHTQGSSGISSASTSASSLSGQASSSTSASVSATSSSSLSSFKTPFFVHDRSSDLSSSYGQVGQASLASYSSVVLDPSASLIVPRTSTSSSYQQARHSSKGQTNNFQCNICGQVFPLKNVYQSHMKTHNREKGKFCCMCTNQDEQTGNKTD